MTSRYTESGWKLMETMMNFRNLYRVNERTLRWDYDFGTEPPEFAQHEGRTWRRKAFIQSTEAGVGLVWYELD